MRHVSVRRVFMTVALCLLAPFARAGEPAWDEVVERAAGQAVFWNAWGGDERINAYIAWIGLLEAAGLETEQRHVGRGRVRRYPKVMAFWCALFAAMADRGFSALEVTRALAALNLHQADVAKRGVDQVLVKPSRP